MSCADCKYFDSCFDKFFDSDGEFQFCIPELCVNFTVKGGDTFDRD